MSDEHYPTVDFHFFYQLICNSDRVEDQTEVGSIIAILLKGKQPVHKRMIYLKKSKGNIIRFEQATGIAIRLAIMEELLLWYKDNRNWKDGGYFKPDIEV